VERLSANFTKISLRTGMEYSAASRWELAGSSSAVSHRLSAMSWMSILGQDASAMYRLAAVLWPVSGATAADRDPLLELSFGDVHPSPCGLLSAALLVPVAILVLAFPGFYRG
jgi:hypothetical protein